MHILRTCLCVGVVELGLIEYVVIKSIGLDASAEPKDRHEWN